MTIPVEVTIDRLGGGGDGLVGSFDGSRMFVPGALAGEVVEVRPAGQTRQGERSAELVRVLRPSPDRVEPPCPHAADCGGCSLQHLALPAYAAFLEQKVRSALHRQHLDRADILPADLSPLGSRRRIRLGWQRTTRGMVLGMRERGSHRIVDWTTCLVAKPELVAALGPLHRLLSDLSAKSGEVAMDYGAAGIDLLLLTDGSPRLEDRVLLAAALDLLPGVCRISWSASRDRESEPIVTRSEPFTRHGLFQIALAPGGFRQATDAGEATIVKFLNQHIAKRDYVVDLFGGSGTLGLELRPLPGRLRIVEADATAVASVAMALAAHKGATRIDVVRRDLDRDPMRDKELLGVDAIIIDPPRAGARRQCSELAKNGPEQVIYVSCDPGTFARDARILCDGGYRLGPVQPIGQFLWSDRVELAASFRRHAA